MKKLLGSLMLTGLLFAGTACGSDDSTETETTEAPASESGESGESGDSAVAEYCAQAEELAAELKDVMADPTKGDMAALTTKSQELVAAATDLAGSSPDDLDEINACSQKITAAVGG